MQSISQTWFRWFGMMLTKYDDLAIRHCWQISPERRMVIVCGVAQIAAKKALLTSVSFFFSIHFHLYVGSMFDMRRLHLAESCASYLDSPLSDKSVPVLSIQPPPLWSSSPSFHLHLHHNHSFAHILFFSSQYTPLSLHFHSNVYTIITVWRR